MHTVYLREPDLERLNELEYLIKRARRQKGMKGRVGPTLVLRAGLQLLVKAFERGEEEGLEAVLAVSDAATA